MTLITLGGIETPRPLALKSDIQDIYTRMDAVNVTINGVELGVADLADKGGRIDWGNIIDKPVAAIGVTGVVTLTNDVSGDKTRAATMRALAIENSNGFGFVPQSRQVNSRTLDRDVTLTAEDIYSLSNTQVDALIANGYKLKKFVWGPAVTTAMDAVPLNHFITSFTKPGDPVISRPLQLDVIKNGQTTRINVRKTA